MKQALKVKLEMAKFLQQTLDDMAVQGKGRSSEAAKEFAEFFVKVKCYFRFPYLGARLTV
jgi:LETM1 and EF-hand domain-containing protein 1